MLIKIKPEKLTVKHESFTKAEENTFEQVIITLGQTYSDHIRLNFHEKTTDIIGRPDYLFFTLYILSQNYDIEIM